MSLLAASAYNSLTPFVAPGEASFTTTGNHSFIVPAGVTSICAVCVGGGGGGTYAKGTVIPSNIGHGGGGGGLRYINNLAVTPGETLAIVVGKVGSTGSGYAWASYDRGGSPGGNTTISRGSTVLIWAEGGYGADKRPVSNGGGPGAGGGGSTIGGNIGGGNGGNGGAGTSSQSDSGGGGAGGYTGNGGNGMGVYSGAATAGAGGGGGGGHRWSCGGGVGLFGIGGDGAPGTTTLGGGGGSGGEDGTGSAPGNYGGGGDGSIGIGLSKLSGHGAVRIIWGTGRFFPNNAA